MFGRSMPQEIWNKHITCSIHILFYMFVLYLVILARRQNAHCDVGRFLFVFSLNRNVAPSLKAYLNYNFYQKIHELTYYPPKTWNLYKFSVKMTTSAAPDCCMICFGLHQRVIGEAIDHVAWTAARLCRNWWTRLQTLAGIIWTLLDSYLMSHWLLCGYFVFDAVGLPYTVEIVARFYTVQYKHTKRHVALCAFVFVPNFLEYVSVITIRLSCTTVEIWTTKYIQVTSSNFRGWRDVIGCVAVGPGMCGFLSQAER